MPGEVISHYKIIRKLGAGGMGEVYLAGDTRLDRKVALKILPEDFTEDEERLRRFTQEAKAASALNHPNIITIHDIGEDRGVHYIATEFIEGETLRQHMRRGRVNLLEALDISIQAAGALSAAHQSGIIHRDIKPENIMLRPDGYVKVLDFGLAKLTEQQAPSTDTSAPTVARVDTAPGMIFGTLAYMSPEQARGKDVDARTDVFSFGVLLYEMATGHAPFKGETTSDIIAAILKSDPPPISHYSSESSAEFERIVGKALRKDREERYQTMKDMLIDLKNLRAELDLQGKLSGSASLWSGGKISASAAGQTEEVTAKEQSPSIAVLPFVNMSADPENEYFCDGLTEELLNGLAKIEGLRVAARSSAFAFKGRELDVREIGQKLGVNTLLEGSVRKSGSRLRIAAQLINVADGYHLWSQQYDRQMADIFDIQDDISLAIVDALKVELFGQQKATLLRHYTENTEAYELHLKGRYQFYKQTEESLKKAIEYYEQALEKEQDYAVAYAEIANTYATLLYFGHTSRDEALPKISAALDKAIKLDGRLAEAHLILARKKFHYDWDWSGAEREFKRAIELNPNYAEARLIYAFFLADMGRFDEAIAEGRRARELDPLSLFTDMALGFIFLQARRVDDALSEGRKLVEMETNFFGAHWLIGAAYYQKGMYADAISECREAVALGGGPSVLAFLGFVYGISGEANEALRVLEELNEMRKQRHVPASSNAVVYIGLGEIDQAFEWLEKAYEERDGTMTSLKVNNVLDSLRSDPRFQMLLSRVGLRGD